MSFVSRYSAWMLFLVAVCAPQLQADYDPVQRAKAIAPFLDGQMIALAHVDLTRIDPEPLVNKITEFMPEAKEEAQQMRAGMQLVKSTLLKAGAKEVFVVLSLTDLPKDFPVIVLPKAEAIQMEVLSALPRTPDQAMESLRGSVVIAPRRALERLKTLQAVDHPELIEALRAAGDRAIQVVLAPSDNDRRVIDELQPTLPAQLGGGPSTILTRGLLWLAAGIDTPPQLAMQVTIQSHDQESAAALRKKLAELVSLAARLAGTNDEGKLAKALSALVPETQGDRLVLQLGQADASVQALLAAVRPSIEQARTQAQRAQSANNLKQLGLVMHIFHDTHKRFPAVGTFDAAGKPLLSWRVHVLPYLEQKSLYDQFHFNEPWDSEHNRKLIAQMPAVFRSPASKLNPVEGLTVYREITGEHTVFPGKDGTEIKRITDGTSNTIMLVEVDDQHGVVWTKPEGLPFIAEDPAKGLGGQFPGGFQVTFCDGSVRFLQQPIDPETLRRLLMIDDGQPVPDL